MEHSGCRRCTDARGEIQERKDEGRSEVNVCGVSSPHVSCWVIILVVLRCAKLRMCIIAHRRTRRMGL